MIFKIQKRSLTDIKYILLEQKFDLTKHEKSIVSEVKKNQRIQTKNMHFELNPDTARTEVFFCDFFYIIKNTFISKLLATANITSLFNTAFA